MVKSVFCFHLVLTGAFKALLNSKGGVRAVSALPVSNQALLFSPSVQKLSLLGRSLLQQCLNVQICSQSQLECLIVETGHAGIFHFGTN